MRTGSKTEIKLVLIRHGLTKSNLEHRYLGKTNERLSEEGIDRLREKVMQGIYPACDRLFSGPLLRCRESAGTIYPEQRVDIIDEWQEIDFGRFEGKTYSDLCGDPDYQRWIDSCGVMKIPDGESMEEFKGRTWTGMKKMIEILMEDESRKDRMKVSAVVHGGTIMTICSLLADGDYFDYQVKNGEGYILELQYIEGKIELKKLEKL